MIYKFVSVKRVIAKVFTDLDLKEGDHRVTDMVEWAGEAVKKIGAFPALSTKITGKGGKPLLEITDYQSKLPCDITTINQVSYSPFEGGPFYPMTYAAGSFDAQIPNIDTGDNDTPPADLLIADLAISLYGDTYAQALERINTYPNIREQLTALIHNAQESPRIGNDTTSMSDSYTYVISGNYIKTNLRSGFLMISYQAVPVDNEGYPMIPDDESFEEAIYWYINMKLTYPEWKMGRVRDAVYYDAKSSWNFYRKQAYATALMPNVDQLESIKNAWLRLVPEIDEHSTFFSHLNDPQTIYNKNSR
jgi:hypothetical protein